MAQARQRDTWQHTANILAMLFNANRGKASPLTAQDFLPSAFAEPEPELTVAEMGEYLKASGFRSSRRRPPA